MKTALITGGTKGIGKAIAQRFLQEGYEVILNYFHDEESAIATQNEFNELDYCPVLMRADVSDEAQVKDMFTEIYRIFGGLDVLVNNAGISKVNVIQDTTLADWEEVVGVNLRGVFLCSREAARSMISWQGLDSKHSLYLGRSRGELRGGLFSHEGRSNRLHKGSRQGTRALAHNGKLRLSRRDRYRDERLLY